MRHEIETQVPKQARNAYLADRLNQLTEDLYRTYRSYQDVRRELSDAQPITELDRRIRDAIEVSIIPSRRVRESRNLYLLFLVVILVISSLSLPAQQLLLHLGLFRQIYAAFGHRHNFFGVVCFTIIILACLSLFLEAEHGQGY